MPTIIQTIVGGRTVDIDMSKSWDQNKPDTRLVSHREWEETLPPDHPKLYGTMIRLPKQFDKVEVFTFSKYPRPGRVMKVEEADRGKLYTIKFTDGRIEKIHSHYVSFKAHAPKSGGKAWTRLFYESREMGRQTNDATAQRELYLFYETSSESLVRAARGSFYPNSIRKKLKGVYDSDLAVKHFEYLADQAAVEYTRVQGGSGHGKYGAFSKEDRREVAREMRDAFEAAYDEDDTPNDNLDDIVAEVMPAAYKRAGWTGTEVRKLAEKEGGLPKKPPKKNNPMTLQDTYDYVVTVAQNDQDSSPDAQTAVDRAIRGFLTDINAEAIRADAVRAVDAAWRNADPAEQMILHNPSNDPVVVLHLKGKTSRGGKPQRLYVVVSERGRIIDVIDEQTEGPHAYESKYRPLPIIPIGLQQSTYREMQRWWEDLGSKLAESDREGNPELELSEHIRAAVGAALGGLLGAYGGAVMAAVVAAVGSLIGSNWKKVTAGMKAGTQAYKTTPARASVSSRANNPGQTSTELVRGLKF